eukprot:699677-Pelagomonas_calceolata.AAC.1
MLVSAQVCVWYKVTEAKGFESEWPIVSLIPLIFREACAEACAKCVAPGWCTYLLVLVASMIGGAGRVVAAAVGHDHHVCVAATVRCALRRKVMLAPPECA